MDCSLILDAKKKIRHDEFIYNKLYICHPRRPRSCLSGRCDIFGRKFTSRADKPLGTYSYRSFTKPVPDVFEFGPADWPEKK